MKKILIIETGRLSTQTSIAHVRNAIELQKILSKVFYCELIDLTMDVDVSRQWDIILFSYASMCSDFGDIEILVDNQKNCKIGWITNEFELFANDFVKKRMSFMITNFEEHGIKKAHRHDQLLVTNLNTLIYTGINEPNLKKYTSCYYGTYRKYRESYFKKYLQKDMILSTTKKNWKLFLDLGLTCKVTDKLHWGFKEETLNLFSSTLYIEDTKTHNCFNYMANRFFEALQCNCALFFDKSCTNTIDKDIYHVDDYFIVDSYDELMEKSKNVDLKLLSEYTITNSNIAMQEKNKTACSVVDFLGGLSNEV